MNPKLYKELKDAGWIPPKTRVEFEHNFEVLRHLQCSFIYVEMPDGTQYRHHVMHPPLEFNESGPAPIAKRRLIEGLAEEFLRKTMEVMHGVSLR